MRYALDVNGYISKVAFGCYLNNCAEYTGAVPTGYNNLVEWSDYACVQAYYIDRDGNLVLDGERLLEIMAKIEQEAIDNKPLVRKDLYESNEVLDGQYKKATAIGEVVVLQDIKTIAPRVMITGVVPSAYSEFLVFTQGKNLMPCTADDCTISGVTFYRNMTGSISVSGTATEDIEYTLCNGGSEPVFAIKREKDYYLNLGGFECELRCFDGETEQQQYVGPSGLLNLPKGIDITHVILKIPSGTTVNTTFFPQLECGTAFTSYEEYKCKTLSIDISGFESLVPSNDLYPSDDLYPKGGSVLIENGVICYVENGVKKEIGSGNVGLFSDYDTIYATKDTVVEIEYSTTEYSAGDTIGGWKIGERGLYNDDLLVGMVNVGAFRFYVGRYTYNEIIDASKQFDEYPWFGVTDVGGVYCQDLYVMNNGEVAKDFDVYGTLYTASGTVSKSDEATKKEISDLDIEKASDFIYSLKPKQYKFKDGTSDRLHHGLIAQEVKESMGEADWGLYVDKRPEEKGNKALRYEELIADLIATVQSQNKRIAELEGRLKE